MHRSLALAVVLLAATSAFAVDAEHKFESVVPRGAVQRVIIDVPAGDFTVRTGAPGTLSIAGVASRDFDGERERAWAQKVVNDTSVEFYVNGTDAVVRRKFGPNADGFRARKFTGIDLRLDLPPGVDVRFETTAGDIDLAGTFGNVDVDLRAGEIHLQTPRNAVKELTASCRIGEVHANLGNELVTREGIFPGTTRFINAAGRSRVNVHATVGEIHVTLTP